MVRASFPAEAVTINGEGPVAANRAAAIPTSDTDYSTLWPP